MTQGLRAAKRINAMMNRLDELRFTRRKEVAAALAKAREYGNLDENEEYDRVRYVQSRMELEIRMLEERLDAAVQWYAVRNRKKAPQSGDTPLNNPLQS